MGTAGWRLERLQIWLGDGVPTRGGVYFQALCVGVQLCLSVNTGLLLAHPFRLSSTGQQLQIGINIGLLTLAAIATSARTRIFISMVESL